MHPLYTETWDRYHVSGEYTRRFVVATWHREKTAPSFELEGVPHSGWHPDSRLRRVGPPVVWEISSWLCCEIGCRYRGSSRIVDRLGTRKCQGNSCGV